MNTEKDCCMTNQEACETAAPMGRETDRSLRTVLPRTDVWEHDKGLVVTLDMPGVEASGLDVHFEHGTLTVTGRRAEPSFNKKSSVRREWSEALFRRSFQLAETLDGSQIDASLKNGVLTLEIPKSAQHQPRKIQIRNAA